MARVWRVSVRLSVAPHRPHLSTIRPEALTGSWTALVPRLNPNTLPLPTVWPRAEPARVGRCVLLALLAHVWLVLTLGNAPGGTARPGEGVWGAVNVTLRGPATPAALDLPTPPEPAVATGPVGLAETPRWGGAVRSQTAPEPLPEAGAAQLGTWSPLPAPATAEPALSPLPRAPALQPVLPAGPLPEPGRVVEARAAAPLPTPPVERSLASSLARPAAPVAAVPAAALPSTADPAPVLGRLPELSAPAAAPLRAPREAPPPTVAPVAALPATAAPAAPVLLAETPAAALKSLVAAPQPAAVLPPAVAAPMAAPMAAPAAAAVGTTDAGTRLGHDVAGAPALAASAPPRLNLQLARPRGGEISRGMAGGVLAVLPRPPEVDDKLGQQIAKTAKADCRSAYAGAGLLAVVPLAAEALRKDGSCRW